ncbi:extracellular solute-binding protein [Fimbriiglobus ruber]|uniref:ABC transport system, sugar-binding protein n=1 Tax=Fimbriiglobus ruber TaxID=1908690 RepID=A0A225DJF2_9BACT|nr:extracellular solute-binding protein [Fimbriiglobus ruber]OWK38728.1 ABC transport system, sugar-binding protein [Fimbriiglobus ruber]
MVAAVAVGALGCGGATAPPPAAGGADKPFAGVTLTATCPDETFARELTARCAAWAGRTGAKVVVESKPRADAGRGDVVVIRPTEIGAFAAKGDLLPLPSSYQGSGHALQWPRIVDIYQKSLSGWAGEVVALPLAGDGYVLAYRADRFADNAHRAAFQQKHARPLAAPATWEEAAEVAAFFADADKKPSLPPVPADPARLLTEYHQVAACYDRAKVAGGAESADPHATERALSFHIQAETGRPRLSAPGFTAAAAWLHAAVPFRAPLGGPGGTDPVYALDQGSAALAVLSLAEVGRLPRDPSGVVAARFRIANLPGTRTYFDPTGQRVPAARDAGPQGNFVPYLGSGGWVAGVATGCAAPDAGWDLLAELAGVTASLATIGEPTVGAGPFRIEHLDPAAWIRYGFDKNRTVDLAQGMRHYLGTDVTNPALALRTPDQAALMAALETEVRAAATGKSDPAAAIARAVDAWTTHDAAQKPEDLTKWRRNAVNLK